MKNIILLLAGIVFTVMTNAQKLSPGKVPVTAIKAFEHAHPGIKGIWEKENVNYEVTFKEDGKSMSCVIDKAGAIIETETSIAVKELPETVSKYISTTIKMQRFRIVKANGKINYETKVNKKDVVFDEHGNFIRRLKTDKPGILEF